MIIKDLKLINWRNWKEASFIFSPGINLVVGENARGKTNILEAIVLLAITKSWRVSNDRVLVKRDEDFSRLIANFEEEETLVNEELRLILTEKLIKKEIKIDGLPKKMIEVLGRLRVVYFSPEEIEDFFGWPGRRRRWLDILLSVVDYDYAYRAAVYKKVVINRNSLLKKIRLGIAKNEELFFWDRKWEELAVKIWEKRLELIDYINEKGTKYFSQIFAGEGELKIKYFRGNWQDKGLTWPEYLAAGLERELKYGSTLIGPHRDDVVVELDGVKIDQIGSRAQMRLALLALKMGEADYIFQERKSYPILLLDDIFSELDEKNKQRVIEYIQDKQVIITTTEIDKRFEGQDICIIRVE